MILNKEYVDDSLSLHSILDTQEEEDSLHFFGCLSRHTYLCISK